MADSSKIKGRPNRRNVIKGIAGGVLGSSLANNTFAASNDSPAGNTFKSTAYSKWQPIWKLDRPKPALPNSYFWTWDHSTNWMLDDPGMLNSGCRNRYLKQPETYVEDYRRLTDLAAGLGVKGIVIWGFLRDAHGGIDYAKKVADYAASRGVAIMPGVGTNSYGGIYYEGNHKYNINTFTKKYPEARWMTWNGRPVDRKTCPNHPAFVEWLQEGIQWLFREFNVGGANIENGDFSVCHCPKCKKDLESRPENEPAFWWHQYLGYYPALKAIDDQLKDKLISWATYKGFVPGKPNGPIQKHQGAYLLCQRPAVVDKLPREAICQWTISSMVHEEPLPLTAYLEDGEPDKALTNEVWTNDIKPPTVRSVGLLHQGSQWGRNARYDLIVSTIKEGCLRAYKAGLEGISILGEVSSMHIPYALNYLALSHFIHWPTDTIRQFGKKTLGQVLGSEDEGEAYAELLAHWDAGTLTEQQRKDLSQRSGGLAKQVSGGEKLQSWRFWNWLHNVAENKQDKHTVSIF